MKLKKNLKLLMAHAFLSGCWFFIPILYIYLKSKGFSFAEIGFIASCKIGSKFFLEIPAGLISDKFGPKKSLIFSSLAFGIAFYLFGASDTFSMMIVAGIFNGLGQALLSSGDSTYLYEMLSRFDMKKDFAYIMGKKNSYTFLGFSLSAFASVLIVPYGLQWTFYTSSIFLLSSSIMLLLLDDIKTEHIEFNPLKHLAESIKFVQSNASLRSILIYIVFFDISTQLFFHYQQFILKDLGIAEKNLGLIYGVLVLFSLCSAKYSYLISANFKMRSILIGASVLMAIALLFTGLFNSAILIICGIIYFQLALGFSKTILIDFFHSAIIPKKRATVFACKKTIYAFVFLISTPIFGFIADSSGIYVSILSLLGFVIIKSLIIYRSKTLFSSN